MEKKKESGIDSLLLPNPLNHFSALAVATGHTAHSAVNPLLNYQHLQKGRHHDRRAYKVPILQEEKRRCWHALRSDGAQAPSLSGTGPVPRACRLLSGERKVYESKGCRLHRKSGLRL